MPKAKVLNQNGGERGHPKPQRIEVEFVLDRCGAQQVSICGDFNGWKPDGLRLIGDSESGLWEKRLPLAPGRYEYKFVVDGEWVHDPDAAENVCNAFGSLNSVVNVDPKSNS